LVAACGASIHSSTSNGLAWTTQTNPETASEYNTFGGKLVAVSYSSSYPTTSFRVSPDLGDTWGNSIYAEAASTSNSSSESYYNGYSVTNSRFIVNFGNSFALSNDTTTGALTSFTSQTLGERRTVYPTKAVALPSGLTFPLGEMTVGN
jgi:hypothetical protein